MANSELPLNPLARELNEQLVASAPEILAMLSPLGRRLYFPKGILFQAAEAKQKAHRFNATIGIATEKGHAMHLASVQSHLRDVSPDDAFTYAPAAGRQSLREHRQRSPRNRHRNRRRKRTPRPQRHRLHSMLPRKNWLRVVVDARTRPIALSQA